MKKTFQVNISGKVFYIDEDAYELLLNYLNQLKEAFSGAEGEEIVTDIENRISELFDERIAGGVTVIVYQDVNRIIEIMGKPSDISEDGEDCRAGEAENTAVNGNPSATVEEEKTVSETDRRGGRGDEARGGSQARPGESSTRACCGDAMRGMTRQPEGV